jgi:hypothetical protein
VIIVDLGRMKEERKKGDRGGGEKREREREVNLGNEVGKKAYPRMNIRMKNRFWFNKFNSWRLSWIIN